MTGQQLKELTSYAKICNMTLTHRRIGYFVYVVRIGNHDYLDAAKAMKRLQNLHQRLQTKQE